MAKQFWKPGNMVYPLPAVLVSCQDNKHPANLITVAWTGTICTNPAMLYISLRPERHSYGLIKRSGEFVVNLTTKELIRAVDYCGVRSGRDVDKFQKMKLTAGKATNVSAPTLLESPVNIECKVKEILPLGSHHMFLASVAGVNIDDRYLNEKGKFELNQSGLVVYSHGEYFELGSELGNFGFSVKKKN